MGTPTTTTNTPCPTECCSDDDCEDGNCVPHTTATKPSTTSATTASTTTATTTTACQFACCSNDDCEPGFICENGECKKPCTNDADCEGANAICNPNYDNCQYCSADNICENGSADSNCWADMPSCSAAHSCTEIGYPALIKITVQTYDCTNCNTANEGGLELVLNDNTNLSCSSGQLEFSRRANGFWFWRRRSQFSRAPRVVGGTSVLKLRCEYPTKRKRARISPGLDCLVI